MTARPLLLSGGIVVDGTGAPPQRRDVLVSDGAIEAIGKFDPPADAAAVDCTGLTIAPGFIDAHSHSDVMALGRPMEKVRQGVTAEVVGNCGFSAFPCPEDRAALHEFANGILCGGGDWGWRTAADYLADASRANTSINSLVGHGTLRIACAGNRLGPVTEHEMRQMEAALDDALAGGACGFSTGLMYAPGAGAPFEELERLCRITARHGKIYATHMRDYSGRLSEAVGEQIELARGTGCKLQISHFQAVGQRFWDRQAPALELVERARDEGIDVTIDCYPYVAGSTVLTQFLPQWALEGGRDGLLGRLSGPERARVASETESMLAQTWSDIFITAVGSQGNQRLVGRSVEEIARTRGCPPSETVLDIILEEAGDVNVLEFNQSEDNLRQCLAHPLSIVISDGFYVKGRPHPRLCGTFPHLLGTVVRERRWLSLPEAVQKITDVPARRFGLARRGRIERGFIADIVVFDADSIHSPATFEKPELAPSGVRYVFRGGRLEDSR